MMLIVKNIFRCLGINYKYNRTNFLLLMCIFISYSNDVGKNRNIPNIKWINGEIPKDKPNCSFKNDCSSWNGLNFHYLLILVLIFLFLLSPLILKILVNNKCNLKKSLNTNTLLIDWLEVLDVKDYIAENTNTSVSSHNSQTYTNKKNIGCVVNEDLILPIFSTDSFKRSHTVIYKQNRVFVKCLDISDAYSKNSVLKDFSIRHQIYHNNLTKFIAMSFLKKRIIAFEEYCLKGNLQDFLQSHDISLDQSLKYEFMKDIINGMIFLHKSPIKVHGFLTSKNCVIDNRMVLKITNFNLRKLFQKSKIYDLDPSELLWTAPEILRGSSKASQSGDVYSFGIILQV